MSQLLSYPEAQGANKTKKEEKEQKAHHSLPSGGPWNSSVHLVAVFTQPAGHTLLTQGSPEPSERSLLPGFLRPPHPHPGAGAPPLPGLQASPWVIQSLGLPGPPWAGIRS